jgi:hypothetical protein
MLTFVARCDRRELVHWSMTCAVVLLDGRFAPPRSDAKPIYLQDPTQAVKVLLPSSRSSELPN